MKTSIDHTNASSLPISQDQELLEIHLHESNAARILHRPLGVTGYLIVLFHSEALVRLQGIEHPVPPSSLVIWRPGQRQYFGNNHKS